MFTITVKQISMGLALNISIKLSTAAVFRSKLREKQHMYWTCNCAKTQIDVFEINTTSLQRNYNLLFVKKSYAIIHSNNKKSLQ
jgi:hypothetical protein